ncbi:MAG: short-chain dehydrogenase [Rhodospirillaceae bacterium]|nr:short-chain dehydrogenase [Rhodospirillaceae bacterium]
MDRNKELDGKVAIVTGSARNIGRRTALELADAGAAVVINAVTAKELCEEVAHEVEAAGGKAIPVLADITNQDDVDQMVAATKDAFGGIDILVNNAAVRTKAHFTELAYEDWEKLRDVALDGGFRMSMACVPHIIERGGGSVVGIHGMSSYSAGPMGAHKAAVKCGMAGMIRGMARDLGEHNITCNVAVVGRFETERVGGSGEVEPARTNLDVPMGRNGTPQDMADLVRFLVGPYARYISGQTIQVNGAALMPH